MRQARTILCCLMLAFFLAVPLCHAAEGRAVANVTASSTNSSLVAAVTGKKIRVVSVVLSCGATATNVTFRSKPVGTGTDLTAILQLGINGQVVMPHSATGWFETASGEALTVTTGSGSTVGIVVNYILVP